MIGNVRIPAALSLVIGMGLTVSLAIAAAGSSCAYVSTRLAQIAVSDAKQAHDPDALTIIASLQRLQHMSVILLTALVVCSVIVALIGRRWLETKVIHPLDGAMRIVNAIALGELHEPIIVDGKTQARRLFASLAQMRHALVETVSLVTREAIAIDDQAAKLASQNQQLATGAETQAAAIQQTAATTQQISAGIDRITQLASQTNRLAENASALAASSCTRVQALITAIASITAHSQQISEAVSVVNDLAFQSNILALNASVEAARAGLQGKGFAVVAAEVRTLAQRSSSAAVEINDLITRTRATIEQGAALCVDAGCAMDGVVAAAHEVVELSDDMSRSAGEQNLAIQQLNVAIQEIDQVTQLNARTVQLFVEATEDLGGRARALTHTVSTWKY